VPTKVKLTPKQWGAVRKLALLVCDWRGHSHLPFNSVCVDSEGIAEEFVLSLISKKLL
jgi:hypothetical protein